MKLYSFPIKEYLNSDVLSTTNQPIDLEYIVSVSPVAYDGNRQAWFVVYIKLGQPIALEYKREYKFTDISSYVPGFSLVKELEIERDKLIAAWKELQPPNSSILEIALVVQKFFTIEECLPGVEGNALLNRINAVVAQLVTKEQS